ncbi:MAG: hypothetical protein A2Y95_02775 [Deltaproteobacteria bacterium RBG_13_65_10]|nr:MAG: hypothetical protein A2Y95_02775 [Deltaproteobacteria bacterium RBG_13_65_10]
MPFQNDKVYQFTQNGIEWLRTGQMGVYGIFRQGAWIYVGSGDIRARLLDHLNGDNPCITRERPTNWAAEETSDYVNREKVLIREFDPICNKKVG